jgi:uncharacterized RDD family membrane protein YckC
MNYATFWQRFAAGWIDVFVFLPIIFIQACLEGEYKLFAYILAIPMAFASCAYSIYGHGRFGKTIGKHVMGIRVVRLSGEPAGWRAAWMRGAVDIGFAALQAFATIWALASIADSGYYGVGWLQRAKNLAALQPSELAWVEVATQVWIWSEIVVMLFNTRRRALHDYIAGTVVISENVNDEALPQSI